MWLDSYGRFRKIESPGSSLQSLGRSGVWIMYADYGVYNYSANCNILDFRYTLDDVHMGPPYLVGGPFMSMSGSNGNGVVSGGSYHTNAIPRCIGELDWWYEGDFLVAWPGDQGLVSDDRLSAAEARTSTVFNDAWASGYEYGASAWRRFAPKLNTANLGVALAEARDIPRMLKTTAKAFAETWRNMGGHPTRFTPKKVADQWLNTQFGWRPFLNDCAQTFSTVTYYNKRLEQMQRQNNQWQHRSGTVLSTESRDLHASGSAMTIMPAPPTGCWVTRDGKTAHYDVYSVVSDEVWYSARYKYYIPRFDAKDRSTKIRNLLRMYGLRVSPQLVYEATPWSWLVDWFSNTGDVVSNLTSMLYDGMVTKYAYIMRHRVHSMNLVGVNYLKEGDIVVNRSRFIETKSRSGADPFGFSLTWDDFTPWQLSILASLGVSRRR